MAEKQNTCSPIVRADEFQSNDVPWNNRITVKEIVLTEREAHSEVERLNAVNKKKHAVYFWQRSGLVEQDC